MHVCDRATLLPLSAALTSLALQDPRAISTSSKRAGRLNSHTECCVYGLRILRACHVVHRRDRTSCNSGGTGIEILFGFLFRLITVISESRSSVMCYFLPLFSREERRSRWGCRAGLSLRCGGSKVLRKSTVILGVCLSKVMHYCCYCC